MPFFLRMPLRSTGSPMQDDIVKYRRHVFVCINEKDDTRCGKKGSPDTLKRFYELLEERGIKDVKVSKSMCVNVHPSGPAVIVYPEGVWYQKVTAADVEEIVETHLVKGRVVERLKYGRLGTECVEHREPGAV